MDYFGISVYWILAFVGFIGKGTFAVSDAVNSTYCPDKFDNYFEGSCYFYSHDYETWTGAVISCSLLSGHLVEIETLEEFRYLQSADAQHGKTQCSVTLDHTNCETRWVGLSNKRDVTRWEWATSHVVYDSHASFNMWAPGEPDNKKGTGDESCAVMDYYLDLGHNYTLADVNCIDPRHRYICEYTITSLPLVNGFGK